MGRCQRQASHNIWRRAHHIVACLQRASNAIDALSNRGCVMRSNMFVPTLCATLIAALATGSIQAQGAGPVVFDVTASALSGTVACNGGAPTPIAPVDASTSDDNGGLNDASVSSVSADTCGFPLYSIQSVEDASYSADTGSSDVGNGGNGITQVSLLGGIVTYQASAQYNLCGASASGTTADINCQDTTQIQNLVFAGTPITGTFTEPQTVNAVDLEVELAGYCTGIAVFNGSLTINAGSQQQNGSSGTITSAPIALNGTLTCLGLPLGNSMTVSLQDPILTQYSGPAQWLVSVDDSSTIEVNLNLPTFNQLLLENPNQ